MGSNLFNVVYALANAFREATAFSDIDVLYEFFRELGQKRQDSPHKSRYPQVTIAQNEDNPDIIIFSAEQKYGYLKNDKLKIGLWDRIEWHVYRTPENGKHHNSVLRYKRNEDGELDRSDICPEQLETPLKILSKMRSSMHDVMLEGDYKPFRMMMTEILKKICPNGPREQIRLGYQKSMSGFLDTSSRPFDTSPEDSFFPETIFLGIGKN